MSYFENNTVDDVCVSQPFFSIILPTKNRSELIGRVINSVLSQDFDDYELIVVDNDDVDSDGTESIVSSYNDEHIKYFRTGDLSMAENWNYGFSHSSGKYITLIRDKAIYLPGVLSKLYHILSNTNYDSLCWDEEILDFGTNRSEGSGKITEHLSKDMVDMLLRMEHREYAFLRYSLPKTSNSCLSRRLYQKIIDKTGTLAMENAPDYTVAYQILFNTDSVYNIDLSISNRFNSDVKYSTGAQHDYGYLQSAVNNMNSKSTDILIVDSQPLKVTNTETIVISDFFRVARLNGYSYSFDDFDCSNYFKTTYLNTVKRQASAYPDNKDYFKNLKLKITQTMRDTYVSGLKSDLFVCWMYNVFYLRIWIFVNQMYLRLKSVLPAKVLTSIIKVYRKLICAS